MNIVVVIDNSVNRRNFINDATNWVMTHPVSGSLYSVGMDDQVRIGPYDIKFVSRMADVSGLRSIDILYYHYTVITTMLKWEIERRMATGGKTFSLLHDFMEEVFRRADEELLKAKINGMFGWRPITINYPECFLSLRDEANIKMSDVQDILDYNVKTVYDTVYDTVREARERAIYDKIALYYQPTEPCKLNAAICIKELTMNCDVRSNIKDVIFSDRVTVILWKDGTKTMVRAGENEIYDPEKGFAMAVAKKTFGNNGNYYEVFKEYVPTVNLPDGNGILAKDEELYEEVRKKVFAMIDECEEKGKIWQGLTRRKWKELVNKVAKRVGEKRKREEAEVDRKKMQEDMSNYMAPPEENLNSSDKEE